MLSRRLFCSTALTGFALALTGLPQVRAEPITAGAVVAALIKAAAAEIGKRVVQAGLSAIIYSDEIARHLKEISRQLLVITEMIAALPGIIVSGVRDLMHGELEAIIVSYQAQVDSIVAGAGRGALSENQRARLNTILVDLQSAVDRVWQYGPCVYPTAAFGGLLAITIHRLLKSKPAEVKTFTAFQVKERFEPAIDPVRAGSLTNTLPALIAERDARASYLRNYPRVGALGFSEVGRIDGPDGVSHVRCSKTLLLVSPSDIPVEGEFTGSEVPRNGEDRTPFFPDVGLDTDSARLCHGRMPDGVGAHVLAHMNTRLAEYRTSAKAVSDMEAVIADLKATGEELIRAAS